MTGWTAPPEALREAARIADRLLGERRIEEAVAVFERMSAVAPDADWIAVRLGAALLLGNDTARALGHFRDLAARRPRLEGAWQGLGKALYDQHRCDEAVAAFTTAAELGEAPERALYHRGMAHLLAGNYTAGWRDYEHRLLVPDLRSRHFPQPRWDGTRLGGRRLLVVCEQGYGDVFQFVRFLPLLHRLGGSVVFECPHELRSLLAPLLDGCTVVPLRGRGPPDTAFDCHAAMLSLPYLLGLGAGDLTMEHPYLPIQPAVVPVGPGRCIGVCWAGSPTHPQDAQRSMAPELLAPLARVPGVTLVSLQKHASHHKALSGLCDFMQPPPHDLTDFMTTARVMAEIDLVVTVDTAVAHLAGAIGHKVWLLLPFAGEWRWLLDRPDTPWYPTMRLFRQPRPGDWQSVIASVADRLAG